MPSAIKPKADVDIIAENIFTDREEPRQAFWNVYQGMGPGDFEIVLLTINPYCPRKNLSK